MAPKIKMAANLEILDLKKFFHKNCAILRKSKKKAFPDQKQFLAAILNSGAILFYGA
jgi:hypothetical protein